MAVVCAKHLRLIRDGRVLVDHLNFTLLPGQGLLVMGPNGCGKTTLLQTLAGLMDVEGELVCEDAFYLPSEQVFLPHLTVEVNLTLLGKLGLVNYCDFETQDPFQVKTLQKQLFSKLSTGQKQRLLLALLLDNQQPLWLLDEPEKGLDQGFRQVLLDLIQGHLKKGGACIVASHHDMFKRLPWKQLMLDTRSMNRSSSIQAA